MYILLIKQTMFSNLKTTSEFIELKKKNKESTNLKESFSRESLSVEFEPLFLLLESILQVKITQVTLFIVRNKIKWDKYGVSFTCNERIDVQVLENLLIDKDYELTNNTFTLYLD